MAMMLTTSSIAPPAVVKWPSMLFVLEIGTLVGVVAEHALDGQRFDFVVQHRAGAVGIHVADLLGPSVGIFERQRHAGRRAAAFGMRVGNAVSVLG